MNDTGLEDLHALLIPALRERINREPEKELRDQLATGLEALLDNRENFERGCCAMLLSRWLGRIASRGQELGISENALVSETFDEAEAAGLLEAETEAWADEIVATIRNQCVTLNARFHPMPGRPQ